MSTRAAAVVPVPEHAHRRLRCAETARITTWADPDGETTLALTVHDGTGLEVAALPVPLDDEDWLRVAAATRRVALTRGWRHRTLVLTNPEQLPL